MPGERDIGGERTAAPREGDRTSREGVTAGWGDVFSWVGKLKNEVIGVGGGDGRPGTTSENGSIRQLKS